jgi:NAD-dependent SIR2 family protein deacetylase
MASTVEVDRVAEFRDGLEDLAKKVAELATLVQKSRYTVIFTGAGVSTAAGVGDYRSPSGCWTVRRLKELEALGAGASEAQAAELRTLQLERAREIPKSDKLNKVPKELVGPGFAHMAIATMLHKGLAHYVVTTNLDGLFRKAGLKGHSELCCLHGDVFVERCTGCGTEFERNYRVRRPGRHVHDHRAGTCPSCGSAAPTCWTGMPKGSAVGSRIVSVKTRPPDEDISFARVEENAQARWPGATLVAVNGRSVAGESDAYLREVVGDAAMPLRFELRVLEPGSVAAKTGGGTSFEDNHLVGVKSRDVGTKDTHINFQESLDDVDWDEATAHCRRADLCIVMGTSMSLRHVTHFPFMAKKTVIVNLQQTPDDHRCHRGLRLWSTCDEVLRLLLPRLGVAEVEGPPAWRPRDAVPLEALTALGIPRKYHAIARHIEAEAASRRGAASASSSSSSTASL